MKKVLESRHDEPAENTMAEEEGTLSSGIPKSNHHLPSALTVENLRKHEEETDAIDVVELMTKKQQKGKCVEEDVEEPLEYAVPDRAATPIDDKVTRNKKAVMLPGDMWSQPKKPTVEPISSPAVREELRGFKFTGEEYVAVSVDVQTDESYLAEAYQFEWPQSNVAPDVQGRPVPLTDVEDERQKSHKRKSNCINSEVSEIDVIDDESELKAEPPGISDGQLGKTVNSDDSDAAEDHLVNDITESEFGASEAATHTTRETTHTLPSVGPPFILQYKPESHMVPLDYSEVHLSVPGNLQWNEMTVEQREYYNTVMEDMKQLRMEKAATLMHGQDLISIEPHSAYGSQHERKLAKERERERSRMREMKKQAKQAAGPGGQMLANQTNFYAFARQLKTVNYSLSSEKCMEEGWTIRPITPTTPEKPASEIFQRDPNQDIVSGKKYQRMFVKKLYPNGSIFLTVFPDGTGSIWYPSGNVAFSIIGGEKLGKMTFIVHEDIHPAEGGNIQAVFEPSGYCTCYYPSGVIRLFLTPFGGEYYSQQGERQKKWLWKDTHTHVHAPPFQPITFGLSKRVGVRVISQENISVTFNDGNRNVRFNVGTRLRLKPSTLLPKIHELDADQVYLNEKRFRVQSIFEKIKNSLKFPNSPRLEKIQPPYYLASQIGKRANSHLQMNVQHASKIKTLPSLTSGSHAKNVSIERILISDVRNKNTARLSNKKGSQDTGKVQPLVIVN